MRNVYISGFLLMVALVNTTANATLTKEDERAVQALQSAADELATDIAKVNKRHSKEYFKKKIGEIFIYCSNSKFTDKTACIRPRVEALAKD